MCCIHSNYKTVMLFLLAQNDPGDVLSPFLTQLIFFFHSCNRKHSNDVYLLNMTQQMVRANIHGYGNIILPETPVIYVLWLSVKFILIPGRQLHSFHYRLTRWFAFLVLLLQLLYKQQISAPGMAVTGLPLFTWKGKERRKRKIFGKGGGGEKKK